MPTPDAPDARSRASVTRPKLSRELIARTALAVIDREGPEGASIRRVATRLKVHPTSLYNHVPSLAELVEDVRALVSANIDSAPLRALPWPEGVAAWARSYRMAFARHPRTIPVLYSASSFTPILMAEYEDFAVAAGREGWAPNEILPLLTAFESFIIGSVLDMSGPAVLFDPRGQEGEFPEFSAAVATTADEDPRDPVATRAFELGLGMLVQGSLRASAR